jgi:hypothetical protein
MGMVWLRSRLRDVAARGFVGMAGTSLPDLCVSQAGLREREQ